MAKGGGQKFIGRNRAPRVQIEYEVEHYGATKKVDLPFVMGVMSDLSGKPAEALEPVSQRKFAEVDADSFDKLLKSTKPRVAFQVPNTLTDDGGNLSVDITFESMDDFSPAAIAKKVKGLDKLYEARRQLDILLTDVDGKDDAQEVLRQILSDESVLKGLVGAGKPSEDEPAGDDEQSEG